MSITEKNRITMTRKLKLLHKFEKVEEFIYLGSILTTNSDIKNEVQRRIYLANRAYYSLLPIIKNKIIFRDVKIKIYTVKR